MKRARSLSPDRRNGDGEDSTAEKSPPVYKRTPKKIMGAKHSTAGAQHERDDAGHDSPRDNMRIDLPSTYPTLTSDQDQQLETVDTMTAAEEPTIAIGRGPPVLPPLPFERLTIDGVDEPLEHTDTSSTVQDSSSTGTREQAIPEPLAPVTPPDEPTHQIHTATPPRTPTTAPTPHQIPIHWITYTSILSTSDNPTGAGFTTDATLIATAQRLASHWLIQQHNLTWGVQLCQVAANQEPKFMLANGGPVEMKSGAWATLRMYNAVMETRDWVSEREALDAWEAKRKKERVRENGAEGSDKVERRALVRKTAMANLRVGDIVVPTEATPVYWADETAQERKSAWDLLVRTGGDKLEEMIREKKIGKAKGKADKKQAAEEKATEEQSKHWQWDDERRAAYLERLKVDQEIALEQARRNNSKDT